jgi:hypothetical protein
VPDGQHARDLLPFDKFVAFYEQIQPYAEHITLIGPRCSWVCRIHGSRRAKARTSGRRATS